MANEDTAKICFSLCYKLKPLLLKTLLQDQPEALKELENFNIYKQK